MAFFPQDEYVPRRGVAMRTTEPAVANLVGEHRDDKIAREVEIFENAKFVLNNALDKNVPVVNQMRCFDRRKGEHDVIAHTPQSNPQPVPRLRPDLSERALKKLHYPHELDDQDRTSAITMMANSPGLIQKLSKQTEEKWHKHAALAPQAKYPSNGITGFSGMGATTNDGPAGKQRVIKREYDPLRFKFPLRGEHGEPAGGIHARKPDEHPLGLGCIPEPHPVTVQEHFQYDDGQSLEGNTKKVVRHPHFHTFPDNFKNAPNADIPGLHGLGKSDQAHATPSGKKYIMSNDAIYSNFDSYTASQRQHQDQLEQIQREQYLRNSASEYHQNRYNGNTGPDLGSRNGTPPPGVDNHYSPSVAHNSPAYNSQPQLQYSTGHPQHKSKAPHRVAPLKPDTLANNNPKYHASQSSWQMSPQPKRWVPGSDAARTQFH